MSEEGCREYIGTFCTFCSIFSMKLKNALKQSIKIHKVMKCQVHKSIYKYVNLKMYVCAYVDMYIHLRFFACLRDYKINKEKMFA